MLLLLLFACGGSEKSPQPPTQPDSVTVIDRGSEPRSVVRYALAPHTTVRRELSLKQHIEVTTIDTTLHATTQSADSPTVRFVERMEIGDVSPSGDAMISSTIEDVLLLDDGDPKLRRTLEPHARSMNGMRKSLRLSPSGQISDFQADLAAIPPAMREELGSITRPGSEVVRFPDAEIGTGASWQTTSELRSNGFRWMVITKYHLVALDGDTAKVVVDQSMRAGERNLTTSPNAFAKFTSGTGHATNDVVVQLHSPSFIGASRASMELHAAIVRGNVRLTQTYRHQSELSIKAAN